MSTPLAAVGKGLVAGAAGTAAMTAYQMAVAKLRDAESSTTPAEVGKRVIRGVLKRDVDENKTEELNNAVHAVYGTVWGTVYAIVASDRATRPMRAGALFGSAVWGASLVELPAMKLAPPVWEQAPLEVALDLSYHLVFGFGVAGAFALMDR
jgi:hypothetical protein